MRILTSAAMVVSALFVTASAEAQAVVRVNEWARGTELGVVAGGGSTTDATGPLVAASAGWDVTRWLAIEGQAGWLSRGPAAEGFSADISSLINLRPKQSVTPFVGAGIGLYRATFDSASAVTDFYRKRLEAMGPVGESISFTDPAARFTVGIDFIWHRHWSVRPEGSLIAIWGDGHGDKVITYGARIGYRFEDHPITPSGHD